ncbi:MAG: hypothetical protein VX641_01425 [Planctomycetota bacterium]|nr:hypothetical protein [Planctomycetota bacterium]
MKFPTGPDHVTEQAPENGPDVTRGVLDQLGVCGDQAARHSSGRDAIGQLYRFRFVVVLGGIVMLSVIWRSLAPSEDSVDLVEQFPQTIQEGRAHRAQLLMGFLAPFDKVDRAIDEVGREADSLTLIEGLGDAGPDTVDFSTGQPCEPAEVRTLEASAPFPSS